MKKIINSKRYDTETSAFCGEYSSIWGDFHDYEEQLYQKRTGEYFLYGKGGPLSRYAVSCGNAHEGGEDIVPLTVEEAMQWAEKHLDAEKYETLFNIDEEVTGKKKSVLLSLDDAAVTKLKNLAGQKGLPMSRVVENLILKA